MPIRTSLSIPLAVSLLPLVLSACDQGQAILTAYGPTTNFMDAAPWGLERERLSAAQNRERQHRLPAGLGVKGDHAARSLIHASPETEAVAELRLAANETKGPRVGAELTKAQKRIAELEEERDALAGQLVSLKAECAADKKRVETLTWANEVLVKELDSAYTPGKPVEAGALPEGMRAVYAVQKGESLSTIAQIFYGDQQRWKDLFEANRASIENPDRVEPGTVVLVPK